MEICARERETLATCPIAVWGNSLPVRQHYARADRVPCRRVRFAFAGTDCLSRHMSWDDKGEGPRSHNRTCAPFAVRAGQALDR